MSRSYRFMEFSNNRCFDLSQNKRVISKSTVPVYITPSLRERSPVTLRVENVTSTDQQEFMLYHTTCNPEDIKFEVSHRKSGCIDCPTNVFTKTKTYNTPGTFYVLKWITIMILRRETRYIDFIVNDFHETSIEVPSLTNDSIITLIVHPQSTFRVSIIDNDEVIPTSKWLSSPDCTVTRDSFIRDGIGNTIIRTIPFLIGEKIVFKASAGPVSHCRSPDDTLMFGLLRYFDRPISERNVPLTIFKSDFLTKDDMGKYVSITRTEEKIEMLMSVCNTTAYVKVNPVYHGYVYPFFQMTGIVKIIELMSEPRMRIKFNTRDTYNTRLSCLICLEEIAIAKTKQCNHLLYCKRCYYLGMTYYSNHCSLCGTLARHVEMLGTNDISLTYDNIKFLARGGNGIVVRARSNFFDVDAAIKIVAHSQTVLSEHAIREVAGLSRSPLRPDVSSERRVVMYEAWLQPLNSIKNEELRDRIAAFNEDCTMVLCISMELCDYNLRDIISSKDGLYIHAGTNEEYTTFKSKIELFARLSNIVRDIHLLGLIHRDLKPENVLFIKNERGKFIIKLADFGGSCQPGNAADAGVDIFMTQATGTRLYCAPEQVSSSDYDAKVDVHALGVILLEMLAPMKSRHELEGVIYTFRTTGNFPDRVEKETREFSRLIKKMISEDPDMRPCSYELDHVVISYLVHYTRAQRLPA